MPVWQEAETTVGVYPMADPEKCPKCGRNLRERPRPERVAVPDFPGEATYGTDPVCGARWHVWDKTSPLRSKARPYVAGEK
ncbi:hypothetical protein ACWGJB_34370 [Streptomyces sp. NPDC054813]